MVRPSTRKLGPPKSLMARPPKQRRHGPWKYLRPKRKPGRHKKLGPPKSLMTRSSRRKLGPPKFLMVRPLKLQRSRLPKPPKTPRLVKPDYKCEWCWKKCAVPIHPTCEVQRARVLGGVDNAHMMTR
jgi:hypothetical protein